MKDSYDWFEPLYARAAGDAAQVPWALPGAVPYLTNWLKGVEGTGRSALVVGCGLGDDAQALAAAGFKVTAFDISASAIAWAKSRFPHSSVHYVVADLFELPAGWQNAFDVVFEFRTIQALPLSVRSEAISQIATLPKPGGTLLVATYLRRADDALDDSAPWPLSEQELAEFEALGMRVVKKETFQNKESRFCDRIQIQYQA
jgi:SAM-dependent methyltransferase